MTSWLLALIGAGAGLLSGMLALGGGLVLVGLLLWLTPLPIQQVGSVALLHGFVSGVIALPVYRRHGSVQLSVGLAASCAAVVGALAGAVLSARLPSEPLELLFLATLAFGVVTLAIPLRRGLIPDQARQALRLWAAGVLGAVVGILAGLIGVGGGVFIIPLSVAVLSMTPRQAIATALVVGLATSAAGLTGKFLTGQVPVVTALTVVAGSLPGARLGAALNRRLPPWLLRALLVGVLVALLLRTAAGRP